MVEKWQWFYSLARDLTAKPSAVRIYNWLCPKFLRENDLAT